MAIGIMRINLKYKKNNIKKKEKLNGAKQKKRMTRNLPPYT